MVGVLGGEVGDEAVAEGLEVFGAFEGEDGELGGEAVLDGVETGFGFTGGGAGAGGFLRILLTCGLLSCGEGPGHAYRVAWGSGAGRKWGDGGVFVLFGLSEGRGLGIVVTGADGGRRSSRIGGWFRQLS